MDTQAIEQIAVTLAHEVKNPLSLVRASIDLLESRDEETRHKRNYELIKVELKKIDHLIMQFLNIAKGVEEEYDIVYLSDIVADTINKYDIIYDHIDFTLDMESTELVTKGNSISLGILLDNILKNSVEAIVQGTGSVHITLKEEAGGEDGISIEIKDTGTGIEEGLKTRINEDFFTTKETGTGLGVGICHKIAKEHGGKFTISNWEKGTVATVVLPKA